MGASDTTRIVETKWTVNDQASAKAEAVGYHMQRTGAAMTGLGSIVGRLTPMLGAVSGAIATITAALSVQQIASISDQFEKSTVAIAGFLSAFGLAKDFNAGLTLAAQTMQDIQTAAAALPGEAEDYITVFRTGLPEVQEAMGGTVKEMYDFTNKYAATMNMLQVDAAQAGRDLRLMLRSGFGGAGMDVKSFTVLIPFMKQVEGHADITREKFNKLSGAQRAALLQATLASEGLSSALKKSETTFDAMKGALSSTYKLFMRVAGEPIFEGLKAGIGGFNAMLVDTQGNFTAFGQRIVDITQDASTFLLGGIRELSPLLVSVGKDLFDGVVTGLRKGMDFATSLIGIFRDWTDSPSFQTLMGAFDTLSSASGAVLGQLQAGFMKAISPEGLGGGLSDMLDRGSELLATASMSLAEVWTSLAQAIEPVTDLLMQFGSTVMTFYESVFPKLYDAISMLFDPIAQLVGNIADGLTPMLARITPALAGWWSEIAQGASNIASILNPTLLELGDAVGWLLQVIQPGAVTAMESFVEALTAVIHVVNLVLGALARLNAYIYSIAGGGGTESTPGTIRKVTARTMTMMSGAGAVPEVAKRAKGTPGARGGGKTVQDFRYSRFQIDQKFAEGFDPGRIAVAFAKDLQKVGERRLQSGLEPLFSVR